MPSCGLSRRTIRRRATIDIVRRRCVDLYAGAGGATLGLRRAGFRMLAAVENDPLAAASLALNHRGIVLAQQDIRDVHPRSLRRFLGLARGELDLLKACPPCQGFSSLANGTPDEARNDLVLDVATFAEEFLPKAVLVENVPGLRHDQRFASLLDRLSDSGYRTESYLVDAANFGVPQRRKRLIAIALSSAVGAELPERLEDLLPHSFDLPTQTAGDALARLAAEIQPGDTLDRHRNHSALVAARIAAVPINGTRFDIPEEHQLPCHRRLDREGVPLRVATASYGRVRSDQPSPTMTTRCTTPACGSFIHPTDDRGLTLREAASFQTFPANYRFAGGYDAIERQIGNAVPVRLAEALGLVVRRLLRRGHRSRGAMGDETSVGRPLQRKNSRPGG
jgi:DNA (cytosine-5)-methyltransferase 1